MGEHERLAADKAICGHIVSSLGAFIEKQIVAAPGRVAVYAAFRKEADVSGAVESLTAMGWEVYAPKTIVESRQMMFYRIDETTEWVRGAYGILEPRVEADSIAVDVNTLHVIVVPGVSFTKDGVRLGYGGGYYDRLFAKNQRAIRVGVGYECQIAGTLPRMDHDALMHYVITEAGVYTCPVAPSF
jgi:5-formyltetrahydrofolate cyclo-ligase